MDTMNPIRAIKINGLSLLFLMVALLIGSGATISAQAIRFETVAQTTNAQCTPGSLCPLLAVPGAQMQIYSTYPSVPATTFTDVTAGTPCPAFAQVTLPGSFSCTTSSDAAGNLGVWVGQGTFYYTLTYPASAGGGIKGPFAFTAGAAGILAAGVDTEVQYNKGGQFGADNNFLWNYTIGSMYLRNLGGNGSSALVMDAGSASQQTLLTFEGGGTPYWTFGRAVNNSFFIFDNVAAAGVVSFGSGANQSLFFSPTSGTAIFTSLPGIPGIRVNGGGFINSTGGYLSEVNSWQAFNSLTDGALLRGYGVAPTVTNTAGGYIDLAPVTYNPHNGGSCIDVDGNPVQQPVPLNGLSNFGANDVIMWVTQSPLMPANGSCGAPLPVGEDWGLAINSYLFARGGLATDNTTYNAINTIYQGGGVPAGGVESGSVIAGTLYPAGTVTSTGTLSNPAYLGGYVIVGSSNGPPSAGTIATVVNPFVAGSGLKEGLLYYDTGSDCLKVANLALTFACVSAGGGGGGSPGGVHFSLQINNGSGGFGGDANLTYATGQVSLGGTGNFITTGLSSGFDASLCTAFNCLQAPVGGVSAKLLTLTDSALLVEESAPGLSSSGQFRAYDDSTLHTLLGSANGGAYVPFAFFSGSFTNGNCASISKSGTLVTVVDAGGACTTGGGGGTVASSSVGTVAVYTAATTVIGGAGLTFNVTTGVLNASAGTTPGFTTSGAISAVGVIASSGVSGGFDAIAATAFNSIQAPAGGIFGLSIGATRYINSGNNVSGNTTPALTVGDSYQYGSMYYNVGLAAEEVCAAATCTVGTPGTGWISLGGGGGGVTSVSAVANQTTVSPSTGAVVVGTVQNIGTTSNPTFNTVTATGVNGFIATNTSGLIFVGHGGTILMDAAGNISASLVFTSTGTAGGFNVTGNSAANSMQTIGGFNACVGSGCASGIAYEVAGTQVISSTLVATFSTVTASGFLASNVNTSSTAISVGGGNFIVNGLGAVSAAGVIASTGVSGGFNVPSNAAANSIQTLGGFNACFSGTCAGGVAFEVAGTQVLTSALSLVNIVNITGSGAFNSTASGASTAFQGGGGTFIVNGAGAVSAAGIIASTGASGALAVNGNAAANSIQTLGGVNACFSGSCSAGTAFEVQGTPIVTSGRNLVNIGSITASLGATLNGGLTTLTGTNSTLFVGTGGNFYNRPLGAASSGVSCSGIADGWTAISSDNFVVVCQSGARFRAALTAY